MSQRRLLTALLLLLTTALPVGAQEGSSGAAQPTPPVRFDPAESLLVSEMIRTDEPPPARSLRIIHVLHKDIPKAPIGLRRTREEAFAQARELRQRALDGEPMAELARRYSSARNAATGGSLGSFARGILADEFDAFLWQAEVGDISEPVELKTGVFLLERIERWAASRTIRVDGKDDAARARMDAILARLDAGEDFATVAGEASEDPLTAPRGGALKIFERGPQDRLLKAATFNAGVGEVVGPIESPLGLHLIQRVPIDSVPANLRETNWARVSAICLIQSDTPLPIPTPDRNSIATAALAEELHRRLVAGADFDEVARAANEDFGGGKQRAGDIGWFHSMQPGLSPSLRMVFNVSPGELLEPIPTNFGWMLLKRTG